MPLDASVFWSTIGKDDYTLKEVKANWDLLTKAQQKDGLKWLGTESLEDAPVRKLRQINNRLREIAKEKALAAESNEKKE